MNRQQKEMIIEKATKAIVAKYEVAKCFKELIERNALNQQNIRQSVKIDIGKRLPNGTHFQSYLHTAFQNPLVHISFSEDEPQLVISSFDKRNGGSVALNLELMENIKIKENCVGDDFLNYEILFHYIPANMDYSIQVVVR